MFGTVRFKLQEFFDCYKMYLLCLFMSLVSFLAKNPLTLWGKNLQVKETGEVAIAGAYVDLTPSSDQPLVKEPVQVQRAWSFFFFFFEQAISRAGTDWPFKLIGKFLKKWNTQSPLIQLEHKEKRDSPWPAQLVLDFIFPEENRQFKFGFLNG